LFYVLRSAEPNRGFAVHDHDRGHNAFIGVRDHPARERTLGSCSAILPHPSRTPFVDIAIQVVENARPIVAIPSPFPLTLLAVDVPVGHRTDTSSVFIIRLCSLMISGRSRGSRSHSDSFNIGSASLCALDFAWRSLLLFGGTAGHQAFSL
jgi:hypothetical protein